MIDIALCVLLPVGSGKPPDPNGVAQHSPGSPKAHPGEEHPMTHSEMTHWLPAPPGVGLSDCPGEMIESDPSKALASHIGDGHGRVARRSELWHCELCKFTIVTEVDSRNVRRIRNGYPAPSIPAVHIADLN